MKPRHCWFVMLAGAALAVAGATVVNGAGPKADNPKKVLVELFTSQGCDMCPAADRLLAALGDGPGRIVRLSFHVDYFNDPWKDPYSETAYSQREMAYNGALGRNDLYFTPMMMIDGRHPMLGSDQPKAQAALKGALREQPGVSLTLDLATTSDDASKKTLRVKARAIVPDAEGRELLVGVAIYENPTTTEVPAGENAGKTLVEHYTVRKFIYQKVQLERSRARDLSFSVELPAGARPERSGIAVFVQDWLKGNVHQADVVAWSGESERTPGTPRSGRSRRAR
jgi:hypothetical protein